MNKELKEKINKPIDKVQLFCRRDFLNKPHFDSDGSIYSEIKFTKGEKEQEDETVLKIRDCFTYVNLNVKVYTEEVFENSIYKLDILINHLQELRNNLPDARKKYVELENSSPKLEK